MEPLPVNESTPSPAPAAVDISALIPVIMLGVKDVVAAVAESRNAANALILEDNKTQMKLWNRAVCLEGILILVVLIGGFGASMAFAMSGQTASAEKVAFALFGFIGGRGFLHIRALISSASKT